jgi:hypothetical protein
MTTITTMSPRTGFVAPSEEQAAALARVVDSAHPWLGLISTTDLQEFRRALVVVGRMWRLETPSKKHPFSHFLDAGNEMLREWGSESVSGNALMGGIIGHSDVAWIRPEPKAGVVLAVALDEFAGKPCSNRWRDVVEGRANLLPPTLPLFAREVAAAQRSVTYRKQNADGSLRDLERGELLWSR